MGADSDGRLYILEELYEKRVHNHEFAGMVKGVVKGRDVIFQADPSEPQFIDSFNQEGLTTHGADNELLPGIQKVAGLLKLQKDGLPRLFVDASCVNTINEFESYRYPEGVEGRPLVDKPLKMMDHLMDAVRYAVMGEGHELSMTFLEV